jgi:hypothetical protein
MTTRRLEPASAAATLYRFHLISEVQLEKAYDRFCVIANSGPQFDDRNTLLRIALKGYADKGAIPQSLYAAVITPGAKVLDLLIAHFEPQS